MTTTEATHEPTVADVLRRGAQRIRTYGWCRWGPSDGEAACGVVTLGRAAYDLLGSRIHDPRSAELTHEATGTVVRFLGVPSYIAWNERGAEDGEHVATVFEKAAAAWEEVVAP